MQAVKLIKELNNNNMEQIRITIEQWCQQCGISTSMSVFAADILLVLSAILLSWLAFSVCHRIVLPLTVRITEKTQAEWDDVLLNKHTLKKACMIVPAIVLWMFIPHIFYRYPMMELILERVTSIYITLVSTKLGLAIIDSIRALDTDHRSARHQYMLTFCGVLKIIVIFFAVIAIVSIVIDRSPLRLLAGLGATSAVLMLVFKDTISGLVAGIRLTSNDMLHKGDWITVGKAGINGVVDDITLTTVKVRNYDNTTVTITPQTLVDESFQNWNTMTQGEGRRVTRRVYIDFRSIRRFDLSLRERVMRNHYLDEKLVTMDEITDDKVNLTTFRRYADRYLATLPEINTDMLYMVRQLESTPNGLPLEFYFFLREKSWKNYENIMDDILEHLFVAMRDFGLHPFQYNKIC